MIRHIPALIRHRRQTMLATSALAWGMAAIPVAHAQTPTPINETPIAETSSPPTMKLRPLHVRGMA